ncbi:MAG TPA: hypothetical protein DCZ95_10045 [Verrucomicrobia bacterium]|nr:MAG: hypothetical protein A2X46_00265 [Lentisphaerae bacterium GWF2_57_35]HBA84422.1 hypothetical protein [Verrucomicrobiota bacterium]
MFSKEVTKKLLSHFSEPRRYDQLIRRAEDGMGMTKYKIVQNFIHDLEAEGIIKSYSLTARNTQTITLYASRPLAQTSPYEVAYAMFPTGYFCNLTSIYFHALTNQIPTSIYVGHESPAPKRRSQADLSLTGNKLRSAFIKPHRYTRCVFECNGCEIVVVERAKNSRYGVIPVRDRHGLCPEGSQITSIERALIDAIVGPQYNGGIISVYEYFKNARQKLNIQKLLDIYGQMSFIYPYAQSIGFFLERLGLREQATAVYKAFPPKQTFFVDHNAKSTWKYDEKWKLYYPDGLVDED